MDKKKKIIIESLLFLIFLIVSIVMNLGSFDKNVGTAIVMPSIGFVAIIVTTLVNNSKCHYGTIIHFVAVMITLIAGLLLVFLNAGQTLSIALVSTIIVVYLIFIVLLPKE